MSEPMKKKIKRSRFGCHRCKKLKIKCSEERPACAACLKVGSPCDYSLKLTWGGRPYKNADKRKGSTFVVSSTPSDPGIRTGGNITFVNDEQHNKISPDIKSENDPRPTPMSRASTMGRVKSEPVDYTPAPATPAELSQQKLHSDHLINRATQQDSELLMSFAYSPPTHASNSFPSPSFSQTPSFMTALISHASNEPKPLESPSDNDSRKNGVWDPQHYNDEQLTQQINSAASDYLLYPLSPSSQQLQTYPPSNGSYVCEEEAALNTLRSIPPQLSPLPELLLDLPFNREMFQFWIEKASHTLVPAPSSLYKENPFKILLPQMAMHYPGVLSAILAFSARVRDASGGHVENLQEFINQLLGKACSELLKQLQDESEATSDGALALVLLLSCYEVYNSNDFDKHRTHNSGATQIVSAILNKKRQINLPDSPESGADSPMNSSLLAKTNRDESSVAYFLIRWFIYSDVMGALSSTRDKEKYLSSYKKQGEYKPVESVGVLHEAMMSSGSNSEHVPENDIDYFMGFDMRLIPHFINVGLLIQETESRQRMEPSQEANLPTWIVTAALELKGRFFETYLARSEKRQEQVDRIIDKKMRTAGNTSSRTEKIDELIQHDNILRATNKLFFDMAMLNLYRRVLLMPRQSPIVQELANGMLEVLELAIEVGSPAEVCTIFCHFCAGCETLDSKKRDFVFDRYMRLAQSGCVNATKGLMIMNRCWETGQDWMSAAHDLDIDLVLM